jgi:hypothetical protein
MGSVSFTLCRNTLCGSLIALGLYVFSQPGLSQEGKVAPAEPREHSLRRYPVGNTLAMSHNAPDAVEMELASADVLSALARAAELPRHALAEVRFSVRESFGFTMTYTNLLKPEAERLLEVAAAYVTCRAQGHTKVFAIATVEERIRRSTEDNDDYYRKHLFSVFPYLPRSWVKPFKLPQDAGQIFKRFVIIDGSVAWVYLVPIAHGMGRMGRMGRMGWKWMVLGFWYRVGA